MIARVSFPTIAITGASQGLGHALALSYAKRGWAVALADIDDSRGQLSLAQVQSYAPDAFYQHLDVRDEAAIDRWRDAIEQRWNRLDILINNAGVAAQGDVEQQSLQDWQWILDINLLGVLRGCRSFIPFFKKQRAGSIVNTASMAGLLHAPGTSSYNASKAAVIALTETMKLELQPFGVHVAVICPGFFPSNILQTARSHDPGFPDQLRQQCERSSLSAAGIADYVYHAVQKRRFYILPHRQFRLIWLVKRWASSLYFWLASRTGPSLRSPVELVP